MAKAHQRVFAMTAAVLFLISSLGFSAYVIWEMRKGGKDITSQTAQEQLDEPPQCQIGQDTGEVKTAPEVFKPDGDVTELQTTDLQMGTGAEVQTGDCLLVKYHGTLASSGEKFDGNFDQPTLLKLPIGQGAVIQGWDEGLLGMKEGGVRRLVIPSDLAYKESGNQGIPPNSDLVFVVEVVKIVK